MTGERARLRSLAWRLIGCVLFGLLGVSFAACAGLTIVVQQYDGAPRPNESVAVIRVNGGSGSELVSVDGESMRVTLEKGNRLHVEVLPGIHEVELAAPETGLHRTIPVRFVAEPGKVYRFELRTLETTAASWSEPEWQAVAYEVDRNSDAPLRIAARPPESAPLPVPTHKNPPAPPLDRGSVDAGADAPGEES
jgi:hypothetical protein